MTPTAIELAAEQILARWQKGKEPDLTETLDVDALLRGILFSAGQARDDAIHAAELIVRFEAEMVAKLRAEEDPVFCADFARDSSGNIL